MLLIIDETMMDAETETDYIVQSFYNSYNELKVAL